MHGQARRWRSMRCRLRGRRSVRGRHGRDRWGAERRLSEADANVAEDGIDIDGVSEGEGMVGV